ncbi:hypothetical protein ACIA8O_35150 [Kitasatospora sp. NPDC051853]|uniref:hypothetical protein n=1 Tax=Kitasatospora sp. NPDC051853 TaxID=3364058 RepID=UPI003791E34A
MLSRHLPAAAVGLLAAGFLMSSPAAAAGLTPPVGGLQPIDAAAGLEAATGGLGHGISPAKTLRLDPWAGSSADLLNNGLSLEPDNGLAPVGTAPLTQPLSQGGGTKDLPLIGGVIDQLPG